MIIQLGAIFGGLASGLGGLLQAALPSAVSVGQQFLQRELNRKFQRRTRQQVQTQVVSALNAPGVSVARIGGTVQPVGGRVQRATFVPAALTPAQNPFGNVPLLPVRQSFPVPSGFGTALIGPQLNGSARMAQDQLRTAQGVRIGTFPGEPRFAKDEFGKTIMFVPDPRGAGFLTIQNARNLNLSTMKPWWRWNRESQQFEKMKPRRMNPFNFKAASRAGRRIERTLDAVKELVRIERKMTSGKVRLKKRKRKR